MPVLSNKTKSKAGARALKATKPYVKDRARRSADQIGEASRELGDTLTAYAARAAHELGLAEAPKRKRKTPRIVAGMVISAGAVYFLEPKQGPKHRKKVAQLVS